MSFDIFGYKSRGGESESEFLDRYHATDDFRGEEFSAAELANIDQILVRKGFSKNAQNAGASYEYQFLQLNINHESIFMTVPYWDSAEASIDEAVELAILLYQEIGIFFYDPQMGKLITGSTGEQMQIFNSTIETIKKILPQ